MSLMQITVHLIHQTTRIMSNVIEHLKHSRTNSALSLWYKLSFCWIKAEWPGYYRVANSRAFTLSLTLSRFHSQSHALALSRSRAAQTIREDQNVYFMLVFKRSPGGESPQTPCRGWVFSRSTLPPEGTLQDWLQVALFIYYKTNVPFYFIQFHSDWERDII